MKFFCPQCLRIVNIEPSAADREVTSVYCLHRGTRFGGGSEITRMEPVTTVAAIIFKPAAVYGAGMKPI